MKLTTLFATTAAAALTFQLVTSETGSNSFQGGTLGASPSGRVTYSASDEIQWVLNEDGSLVDRRTLRYLNIENGYFVLTETRQSSFSIESDSLAFNGIPGFGICPLSGAVAFRGNCTEYTSVSLLVVGARECVDYHPGHDKKVNCNKNSTRPSTKPSSTHRLKPSYNVTKRDERIVPVDLPIKGQLLTFTASRSGNWTLQGASIQKAGSSFVLSDQSGDFVTFQFQNDGSSLADSQGRGVVIRPNGDLAVVAPNGREQALPYFSTQDGFLTFKGDDVWWACPVRRGGYSISKTRCGKGEAFRIRVN